MAHSSLSGRVYNVLLERNDQIVSTKQIKTACKLLGVEYKTAMVGLSRDNVLEPVIFKGVYYLKNREERDLGTVKGDPILVVAQACNLKLGENWYFGLATALKLSGLWEQQTLTTITIISKARIQRSKTSFGGTSIEFKQLSKVPFHNLVRKQGIVRFSEPGRTLIDYVYFGARNKAYIDFGRIVFLKLAIKFGSKTSLIKKIKPLIGKYPGLYSIFLEKFFEEQQK